MTELEKYREEIDQELTRLVERRLNVVKKVANYKIEHDLPVLDASREEVVIKRNQERLANSEYKQAIAEFYTGLMAISRNIQDQILK